ncbi:MAG: hypothetical protein NC311_17950 [Muribaculaceae bacterium]|nr:hypothetical protein [Muribaculaceae bacterium]
MKILLISLFVLFSVLSISAETITAHYFGSEIDLTQKNNPCKGNTDGGVEVIVTTNVNSAKDNPNRTVIERIYKLPNGEVLKSEREVVDSPKMEVLHKLFPREYPKAKI